MVLRPLKKISDFQRLIIMEELKTLFRAHEEVIFALLYGSMAAPTGSERYGDVDIAIYVRPDQLKISEYILESKLEAEAIHLLSAQGSNLLPIEISIINNAPYSFLTKLFKDRYIVLKDDEEALTNFIEEVGQKSMANSYFRSQSLRELTEV